jgi:hypothetical protein
LKIVYIESYAQRFQWAELSQPLFFVIIMVMAFPDQDLFELIRRLAGGARGWAREDAGSSLVKAWVAGELHANSGPVGCWFAAGEFAGFIGGLAAST